MPALPHSHRSQHRRRGVRRWITPRRRRAEHWRHRIDGRSHPFSRGSPPPSPCPPTRGRLRPRVRWLGGAPLVSKMPPSSKAKTGLPAGEPPPLRVVFAVPDSGSLAPLAGSLSPRSSARPPPFARRVPPRSGSRLRAPRLAFASPRVRSPAVGRARAVASLRPSARWSLSWAPPPRPRAAPPPPLRSRGSA